MTRLTATFAALVLALGQGPAMACVSGGADADPDHGSHVGILAGAAEDTCPHCDPPVERGDVPPCGTVSADSCTSPEVASAVPSEPRGSATPERDAPPAVLDDRLGPHSTPPSGVGPDVRHGRGWGPPTALHLRHCRFDE